MQHILLALEHAVAIRLLEFGFRKRKPHRVAVPIDHSDVKLAIVVYRYPIVARRLDWTGFAIHAFARLAGLEVERLVKRSIAVEAPSRSFGIIIPAEDQLLRLREVDTHHTLRIFTDPRQQVAGRCLPNVDLSTRIHTSRLLAVRR